MIYIFLSLLLAFSAVQASVSLTSYELCTTKYGITLKSSVPSTTYVLTETLRATVTSTLTSTVTTTPSPAATVLSSISVVITSVPTTTNTATLTSTDENTVTSTSVTISTSIVSTTTTTTAIQSTITIPAPVGFTYPSPVPSPPAKKRELRDHKLSEPRSYPVTPDRRASQPNGIQNCSINSHGTRIYSPPRYPTSVICGELVKLYTTLTVVNTAKTTATVIASQSTITSHTTVTSTSTTFYVVSTSTTTTTSSTLTVSTSTTTTTITTTTSTVTVTPPAATYYAACAPQNIVSPPSGYFFESYAYSPFTKINNVVTPDDTAYECCVACITDPYCKVAEFNSYGGCQLDYGDSTSDCTDGETVSIVLTSGNLGYVQAVSVVNTCNGAVTFSY